MVNKCVACQKSVYPLEAIVDGENWYHKGCFKVSRAAARAAPLAPLAPRQPKHRP